MKYTLRKYQEEGVEVGVDFFNDKKQKKKSIIVMPTAAGKSLVIANIASRLSGNTICIQPTKELLKQNYDKFVSYGEKASIYSASFDRKEISETTFATIGSVFRKPELFKDFTNVIIDECHLMSPEKTSTHFKFLNALKVKVLGLTATPFRLKSYSYPEKHSKLCMLQRIRPKIWQDIIYVTQIQEMVDGGYWAPIDYIVTPFDRSKLVLNTTGSDYTMTSLVKSLNDQGVIEQAIYMALKMRKQGCKRVLLFLPDIASSNYVASKLGINSVTSETHKKDREVYLERFASGDDWGVCNVNVLSVGYDNQQIDCIIDCQPTMSMARYYQKLGRGVRIDMSPNPIKEDCVVVDLVDNHSMFGKIEDLVIKDDNGWGVFSSNRMLTNEPFTKDSPVEEFGDFIMEFGIHKGEKLINIPESYLDWVYNNWERNQFNDKIFRFIENKN